MFGKVLFEDSDYKLLRTVFGSYKVECKFRGGMVRKARQKESLYFKQVLEAMQQNGENISPGSEDLMEISQIFCQALVAGGATWEAFFAIYEPGHWSQSKNILEDEVVIQPVPTPIGSTRPKLKIKMLFVVPYQDMDGNLRRKWYGSKGNAKKGHTWFKKAQRLGKVQNLYPPMEQAVPEIDAMPKTKRELVEALNLSYSYEGNS